MAEPGEFTRRAFLNGRMDLSQAEAVMEVIHARGERALAAARHHLQGGLGRRVGEIVDRVLGVLARLEAYIDFPEEDLPPEDRELVAREPRHVQLALAQRGFGLREHSFRDGELFLVRPPVQFKKRIARLHLRALDEEDLVQE